MLIRHIGHAEFLLETESGLRVVTDPYDATCGYPIHPLQADIALVSHHHHDHDAVENLTGNPLVIDEAGSFLPAQDLRVTALRSFHDEVRGAKRGETLLFLIETEGLRLVHLGDMGTDLEEDQLETLKNPDVLMIPVGGFYTIDGNQAREIARKLQARIVLPMHYRTQYNQGWPITGPEPFLSGWQEKEICRGAEALRVTEGDMMCQPKVVLFGLK